MSRRSLSRRLAALTIRWRLALVSAGLTFAILLAFAIVIGAFTADRLVSDFDRDLRDTAEDLQANIAVDPSFFPGREISAPEVREEVIRAVATGDAAVRIVEFPDGPAYGSPVDLGPVMTGVNDTGSYRVVSQPLQALGAPFADAYLQYGRQDAGLESTIARVQLFLALGVLGGTALALLAGLAVARRAMGPIAGLTSAAKDIARTGDPAGRMPEPRADDEVADLARTLGTMLRSLDSARRETEATLSREREFVADASHELRTPLTSVLANLELLEAELEGEEREIAGSALRSTQRMRRLVGDLLFLARADAGSGTSSTRAPTDLGTVTRDVVAETAPLASSHQVAVSAEPGVIVEGFPDDLHRLVLNLVQNAVA
ncbi:MAG TPA: HAMP domain-containing sensor histidine kinase, partial [Thermoleophilaceae bacterium]|nr:HAMP domain-containing sensor histidine kinase [Thermoleophilaceae bacterium]